jgi:hypothetical protein
MPKLFLERFQEQLNEHTSKWRSSETPVIIAAHPAISKAFLRWLFDEEESFPNSNVELEHHMINGEPIKINVAECLSWLTKNADKEKMMSNKLIQDSISDLTEYALTTDETIDLLDLSTWGEYRFHRAEDMIWNSIAS